ncbi:MAG: M48 family metalloprotease [Proteobacteria bacterium]|nr:M48 family metalloprotease [Pseudomonadota bacterium]MBU2228126.1 M48 family metalloprotease [Pseudomonadota bacterium]MBU2260343.1 M48 family metalloprotease [Pseudomonadota bacterium]
MKRDLLIFRLLLPAVLVFSGCQAMLTATEKAATQAASIGMLHPSYAEAIKKSTGAVSRSIEEFTPEQEYYIGRSVAAVILNKYQSYTNQEANQYLNVLGQTLAQASDMPEIFRGYRFLVLNSDEINAFATPGGQVFVTRGLLRCCRSEDAVAAVLAHEIGHIQLKHGIQAIKKARITDALATIAAESARALAPNEVAMLTETFGGAIMDITTTLVNSGYSRSFEYEADQVAQTILRRVGYDPNGLVEMLTVMRKSLKKGETGFARTHPAPEDRIGEIQQKSGVKYAQVRTPEARQDRFMKAVGKI